MTDEDSQEDGTWDVRLPQALRSELKTPLGPVETDTERLLSAVDGDLIAVGDVVTYHLLSAGYRPAVAVVDGMTKRQRIDAEIERVVTTEPTHTVSNPPATITSSLVATLREALASDEPVTILVDGEEDLTALPAVMLAPLGTTVVYGQPDVGMVVVTVDEEARDRVRSLLERFDGDTDALFRTLRS